MESMITKFPPIRSFVAGVFLFLLLGALARQAAADLYVADSETNAVYRYTPDGVQHTFVSIPQPVALAFDPANNLFVASYYPSAIYKIRPNGRKSIFLQGGDAALGLACDSEGSLFVSNGALDPGITEFKRDGSTRNYVSFYGIGGIAIASAGYFYATDINNNNILKIAVGGTFRELTDGFGYPGRLALDSADKLYALDDYNGLVYKIAATGSKTLFAAVPHPTSLVFDHSGYLFVATSYNSEGSIVAIAPDGTTSTFATGLRVPSDLAVPNSL